MKIAVFTFIESQNYGSQLQSFALYEYLVANGFEVDFISVKNIGPIDYFLSLFNKIFNNYFYCFFNKSARNTKFALKKSLENKISYKVKNVNLDDFSLHIKKIGRSGLVKLNSAYDAFICGSDQVWSPLKLPLLKHFFLTFANEKKRMSYAASFGVNNMPQINKKRVLKYVSNIPYISVREETGKRIIMNNLNKSVDVTVDPVFLLDRKKWTEFINPQTKKEESKNVFLFFLNENSQITDAIKQIMKKNGYEVLQIVDDDPLTFIKMISEAKYVFTDSFHAVSFSIIFRKEFFCFRRNIADLVQQESRILDLLTKLDIYDRYHNHFEENILLLEPINYNHVQELLDNDIDKSKDFLKDSLRRIGDAIIPDHS